MTTARQPPRWAAPLRFALRTLSGRTAPGETGAALRRVAARMPLPASMRRRMLLSSRPDAFAPRDLHAHAWPIDLIRPATPIADKPDIFIWALIDWHFRIQRPQHLARALARRGHRVFYISNESIDAHAPGFRPELLDASARLYQVHLNVRGAPTIYHAMPDASQRADMDASLRALLAWTGTTDAVSIVQHAYWSGIASRVPHARIVYDCMDHHAGFDNNAPDVIAAEEALVARADLVVTTSDWLARQCEAQARHVVTIRNAVDFERFATKPRDVFRDPAGRRVIGYHGAIASWFDVELVARVAQACPDALVLLVGADTTGAAQRLAGCSNVQLVGEVAYTSLGHWVHAFDVGLLPFKVTPLTLATNPVKVYEYLAAGVPAVCVDLPEMAQFGGLVRVADGPGAFVEAVRAALHSPPDEDARHARSAFASRQSWEHRADALAAALLEFAGKPAYGIKE